MADFISHLPLSHGRSGDEPSAVGDWRPRTAAVLFGLADLLETLEPEQWLSPSLQPGATRAGEESPTTVQQTVNHLVWRLDRTRLERLLPSTAPAVERELLVPRLRALADDQVAGRGSRRLGPLSDAVLHSYDIAEPLKVAAPVDAVASGAVALGRMLTAPTPIKAVLRGHSLVAVDDGWKLGSGPELRGTAASIVLWLYGRPIRPTVPPEPATPRGQADQPGTSEYDPPPARDRDAAPTDPTAPES